MAKEGKLPFFVKVSWLNLFLVTGWFLWYAFIEGFVNIAFLLLFAVTIGLVFFADWAYRQR